MCTLMGAASENPTSEPLEDPLEALPHSRLEHELVELALGNCSGARVLDLGGGSGGHARQALEAGAVAVDLVDTSMALMELGEELDTENSIRWIMGDVTRPLSEQLIIPPLVAENYDVILAAWPFDHCGSIEQFEALWTNIATYLKPGGRLVGVRLSNPFSLALQTGKYGAVVRGTEAIEGGGGVRCKVEVDADPPFVFESASMEESLMGDREVPERLNISEFVLLKARDTKTVRKGGLEFWDTFVQDPYFVVFTANKRGTWELE